jgi:hypothetical protein
LFKFYIFRGQLALALQPPQSLHVKAARKAPVFREVMMEAGGGKLSKKGRSKRSLNRVILFETMWLDYLYSGRY